MRPKRISCIIADTEAEDEDASDTEITKNVILQQILRDIRREVKDIIREELQTTLNFYSEKIDDYEAKIKKFEINMKTLDNKCNDLQNNLKNSNLKIGILEQKVNIHEQNQLSNNLEICGIKEVEHENLTDITTNLCEKLKLKPDDVVKVYRKRRNNKKNVDLMTLTVLLRDGCRESWLEAAKNTPIHANELGCDDEDTKVYLRESLTPATAYLLWRAKEELKKTNLYKYVWCKNGVILVKKNDDPKSKSYPVRAIQDIQRLAAGNQEKPS